MENDLIKSADGRWGKSYFFVHDQFVGPSLQHYGEYNPDETEFLLKLAAKAGKDKMVLDIGANIGVIAQALEHSGFTVEAFEPLPEVFALLKENIKGKTHNVALGERTGTTKMPKVSIDKPNNFGGFSCDTAFVTRGYVEIPIHKLDDYKFDNIGLMKIDVEGYEERVLLGAIETIKRCRPILYMEDDRDDKSVSLHKTLAELGYKCEQHRPYLYREANFFNKKENIWSPHNLWNRNIVCYPVEQI